MKIAESGERSGQAADQKSKRWEGRKVAALRLESDGFVGVGGRKMADGIRLEDGDRRSEVGGRGPEMKERKSRRHTACGRRPENGGLMDLPTRGVS
jgi:hypothetical protein